MEISAPYEDKYHEKSADGISDVSVALPKELDSNFPASTPYEGHRSRVGVRSTDHRLYQAAAGGHLAEVKKLLGSGFNPSNRTVCDWCPLVRPPTKTAQKPIDDKKTDMFMV